jgi:hypothetical protein
MLTAESSHEEYVAAVLAMTRYRRGLTESTMWKRVDAVCKLACYNYDRNLRPGSETAEAAAVWDGQVLKAAKLNPIDVLHELAHWAVCPEERRSLPNYGLGSGPYDSACEQWLKAVTDIPTGDCEEEISCILTAYVGWLLGDEALGTMFYLNILCPYNSDTKKRRWSWNQMGQEQAEARFLKEAVNRTPWLKDIESVLPCSRKKELVGAYLPTTSLQTSWQKLRAFDVCLADCV